MISPETLAILCCPETKQELVLLDDAKVRRINEAIAAGKVLNRAGLPVTEPIEGGLLCKDGSSLYPIREEIPILLVDESLQMSQFP